MHLVGVRSRTKGNTWRATYQDYYSRRIVFNGVNISTLQRNEINTYRTDLTNYLLRIC